MVHLSPSPWGASLLENEDVFTAGTWLVLCRNKSTACKKEEANVFYSLKSFIIPNFHLNFSW